MRPSIRPDAVLVQAVIAGALSFAHLHDIAEAAGQHGWKAWAYPISVDLLLVAAWRRLRTLRATDGPVRSAWIWFAVALVASLGANVATAGLLDLHQVPAWLRILVAGWPALAFLGGTFLAHNPAPPAQPQTLAPAECDSHPEPAVDPEPVREAVAAPEPAPALPPAPAPVAPPLLAHARKVAAAHLTATGTPIDLDTLRARLGVPTPLAEAIAAQLT
ncbi:DUF2637 domain-containing protein [Streptomyces sp. SID13588]|uniref:DUF2637 domain-containing protein n=1 Tax=Streptomyces sp. SID13588 TaxID=2706051 RepID=UPI0013CD252D|nr:DUF2637 domain-containing protein [Streptomyces sp. SID13588]NEA72153.1 DUF2637 domain-containing protein [Streptomyces sp. SID13588]